MNSFHPSYLDSKKPFTAEESQVRGWRALAAEREVSFRPTYATRRAVVTAHARQMARITPETDVVRNTGRDSEIPGAEDNDGGGCRST